MMLLSSISNNHAVVYFLLVIFNDVIELAAVLTEHKVHLLNPFLCCFTASPAPLSYFQTAAFTSVKLNFDFLSTFQTHYTLYLNVSTNSAALHITQLKVAV